MQTKANRNELINQVIRLVRRIAEIDMLRASSRQVQVRGAVVFEDKKGNLIVHYIVKEWMTHSGSLILVDRDQQLWDETVSKLHDLKRDVISRKTVEEKLTNIAWKYKSKAWKLSGISADVNELIDSIKNTIGKSSKVFFPIWGLKLEMPSLLIGHVEFYPISDYGDIEHELRQSKTTDQDDVTSLIHTVAVAEGIGYDDETIVEDARVKVDQSLNVLRAFTYPMFASLALKQIGIMGDFSASSAIYFVEDVGYQLSYGSLLGKLPRFKRSQIANFVVDEYKNNLLQQSGFERLNEALRSPRLSKIERGLVRGAEWIGEATKPADLPSKFLKVAIAIDAMIGDETPGFLSKGMAARIAERSAFLLARTLEARQSVWGEMKRFFDKRGGLAHGSTPEVKEEETEKFGRYARSLLERLLLFCPPFTTIGELDEWVRRRSFKG